MQTTGLSLSKDTYHLPPAAAEWLRQGVPCPAALFIVQHLTGIPLLNRHIYPKARPTPRNAHELYIVELMLDEVPEFRARFQEMALASPAWQSLVERWPALLASLREEVQSGNQIAPLTTRKLNACTN